MKFPTRRLLFHGFGAREWQRIAFASMLLAYVLIIVISILHLGLFNYIGLDYRTFHASAQIAWQRGFSEIYNLDTQRGYQLQLYESYKMRGNVPAYVTVPTPYFPIFIVLFLPFAFFSAPLGFVFFTILSAGGCFLYVRRLTQEFSITTETNWLALAVLSFSPVFYNLFYGQVSALLFLVFGEFFINLTRKKFFLAGVWISVWLIKPQILIFILPWLLMQKKFRTLAGFVTGAAIIFLGSTLVAGLDWVHEWFNLLILYPGNLATTNPQAMINWRAVALQLEMFLPAYWAWGIAMTGLVATAFLFFVLRRQYASEQELALAVLCVYAITCVVTWHSHIHSSAPLLIPVLYLLGKKVVSLNAWFAFIGIPFAGLLIAMTARFWISNAESLSCFFVVLCAAIWSAWRYQG